MLAEELAQAAQVEAQALLEVREEPTQVQEDKAAQEAQAEPQEQGEQVEQVVLLAHKVAQAVLERQG